MFKIQLSTLNFTVTALRMLTAEVTYFVTVGFVETPPLSPRFHVQLTRFRLFLTLPSTITAATAAAVGTLSLSSVRCVHVCEHDSNQCFCAAIQETTSYLLNTKMVTFLPALAHRMIIAPIGLPFRDVVVSHVYLRLHISASTHISFKHLQLPNLPKTILIIFHCQSTSSLPISYALGICMYVL